MNRREMRTKGGLSEFHVRHKTEALRKMIRRDENPRHSVIRVGDAFFAVSIRGCLADFQSGVKIVLC